MNSPTATFQDSITESTLVTASKNKTVWLDAARLETRTLLTSSPKHSGQMRLHAAVANHHRSPSNQPLSSASLKFMNGMRKSTLPRHPDAQRKPPSSSPCYLVHLMPAQPKQSAFNDFLRSERWVARQDQPCNGRLDCALHTLLVTGFGPKAFDKPSRRRQPVLPMR